MKVNEVVKRLEDDGDQSGFAATTTTSEKKVIHTSSPCPVMIEVRSRRAFWAISAGRRG